MSLSSRAGRSRLVPFRQPAAGLALLLAGALILPAPAPATPAGVAVEVGVATGGRFDVVRLPVRLETGGLAVAGVDVTLDLSEPGLELLPNGRGGPACVVQPDIGKDSSVFQFLPRGCAPGGAVPCRGVRALILSLYDSAPIPDGTLFTCRVRVTAGAPGGVPIACPRAEAGSPDHLLWPALCRGGGVIVQSVATRTPSATPTPTATPAPRSSPTHTPAIRIAVGTGAGQGGELVDIPVRLSASAPVAGALIDLWLEDAEIEFAATGAGLPACAVDPQIGKDDTAFAFLPPDCTPGIDCRGVRAIVLSFHDVAPLAPETELFACALRVRATRPALVPIRCAQAQTSPPQHSNRPIDNYPTTCTAGAVLANGIGASTPTATPSPSPVPPTATPTSSPTPSTVPPSATATVPPSATATVPPSATATEPSATATLPATPTASHTETPSPTATPSATPAACLGDCDGDGRVVIAEIVRGVGIALGGLPLGACAAFDRNGDLEVAVFELIGAVNNALGGCAAPPIRPAVLQ